MDYAHWQIDHKMSFVCIFASRVALCAGSGTGKPRLWGISTIAKTLNICYIVAKARLLQFYVFFFFFRKPFCPFCLFTGGWGGGVTEREQCDLFLPFFLYQGFPKLGSLIFELPVRMHIWHCHTILHICRGRRGQCPWRIFCHVEKFQIERNFRCGDIW